MGPAPFFSEEVVFVAGETLHYRYGVVIADGQSEARRAEGLALEARRLLAGGPGRTAR
jgi:hypothetical protein